MGGASRWLRPLLTFVLLLSDGWPRDTPFSQWLRLCLVWRHWSTVIIRVSVFTQAHVFALFLLSIAINNLLQCIIKEYQTRSVNILGHGQSAVPFHTTTTPQQGCSLGQGIIRLIYNHDITVQTDHKSVRVGFAIKSSRVWMLLHVYIVSLSKSTLKSCIVFILYLS